MNPAKSVLSQGMQLRFGIVFLLASSCAVSAFTQSVKTGIYYTYADFEQDKTEELIYDKTVGNTAYFYTYQAKQQSADITSIWGYRSNNGLVRTGKEIPHEYMVMAMGDAIIYVNAYCRYSIRNGRYVFERDYAGFSHGDKVIFFISADLNSPIIPVTKPNKEKVYSLLGGVMGSTDPATVFDEVYTSTEFMRVFLEYVPVRYVNGNGIYDTPQALKVTIGKQDK